MSAQSAAESSLTVMLALPTRAVEADGATAVGLRIAMKDSHPVRFYSEMHEFPGNGAAVEG